MHTTIVLRLRLRPLQVRLQHQAEIQRHAARATAAAACSSQLGPQSSSQQQQQQGSEFR